MLINNAETFPIEKVSAGNIALIKYHNIINYN